MERVVDVEGRIPQLAWPSWPSSQVVETASSQDEGMYSNQSDSGPIPPAKRHRTDSEDEEMPMMVECSSSGSATTILQDSSGNNYVANAEPYQQRKCGLKDCERWRQHIAGFNGDRCCELCRITSDHVHTKACTRRQAARQGLHI